MTAFKPTSGWIACLLALACVSGAGAAGCGDDDDYYDTYRNRRLGQRDAAARDPDPRDAQVELPDGAVRLPDGAIVLDPGDEDAGNDFAVDVPTCEVVEDDVYEVPDIDSIDRRGFDVTPGPVGFAFGLVRDTCGFAESLQWGRVGGSGVIEDPAEIIGDCHLMEHLALGRAGDGYRIAWTDNSETRLIGGFNKNTIELHAQALGADGVPLGSPERITDNALHELQPVLAAVGDQTLVAWIEWDEVGGERGIYLRAIDGGETVTVIAPSAGHRPEKLALTRVGSNKAALAWVEEVAERGIWLQPLSEAGQPVGEPVQLTPFAAAGSTVDLAGDNEGGAAVYSVGIDEVNFEARFRRLDGAGKPIAEEVKIVSRPDQAVGASVASLGGGFVIAYRTQPSGSVVPEVRLVFATQEGIVARDSQGRLLYLPVVEASRDGSQTDVSVSVDGRVLVSFIDGNGPSDNVLRLVRRQLAGCGD
jgi:hypothetical protein